MPKFKVGDKVFVSKNYPASYAFIAQDNGTPWPTALVGEIKAYDDSTFTLVQFPKETIPEGAHESFDGSWYIEEQYLFPAQPSVNELRLQIMTVLNTAIGSINRILEQADAQAKQ